MLSPWSYLRNITFCNGPIVLQKYLKLNKGFRYLERLQKVPKNWKFDLEDGFIFEFTAICDEQAEWVILLNSIIKFRVAVLQIFNMEANMWSNPPLIFGV